MFESPVDERAQSDEPIEKNENRPRVEKPKRPSMDSRVLAAMQDVPRGAFLLPETIASFQKAGAAIPLGQSMPPPKAVAAMLSALNPAPNMRALQVGLGNGYLAATLARLTHQVYVIEKNQALIEPTVNRFMVLGYRNIKTVCGDGFKGWPEAAPFDVVLVTASAPQPPQTLLDQLAVGGRLVMPIGPVRKRQTLTRITRVSEGKFKREALAEVSFVTLLGDILVEMGVAQRDEVEEAAALAADKQRRIGEQLRNIAKVGEDDVYRALALQAGIGYEPAMALLERADPKVFKLVPRAFLERRHMIPLCRKGHAVHVATSDPAASTADLSRVFPDCAIELILTTPTDYRRLWSALDLMVSSERMPRAEAKAAADTDLLRRVSSDMEAHYVTLFDAFLLDAIGERASDIHFERYGDQVRVRLRVDGELRDLDRYQLSPEELLGLINVIKIRANMDIAERRLPQGGRIRLQSGGAAFDLRVQTQPSLHGEHAVIRLLPQDVQLLTIEDLGFPDEIARDYRRLLESPAGLILVVGPTGSGKSTTLYAGLQILAKNRKVKVITVEDPIEYSIDGVQQTQVKPEIGFTFDGAVRSFLRQDPDVILIGEIRDAETAMEAIRAAQTGHVVLSTLHCNDAIDAVQRLYDLGMHPNSIASELLAVMAQRLAKRVCTQCRQTVAPDAELLAELFPAGPPSDFKCYAGAGCSRCGGHGTYGRVAIVEYLRANPVLRGAISRQLPLDDLRRTALGTGMTPLRDHAIDHARAGLIPLSEIRRIIPAERMAGEAVKT